MSDQQHPQYESFPPAPSSQVDFKAGEESGSKVALAVGLAVLSTLVSIGLYVAIMLPHYT